ncbi:MAG TPA: Fur family transcriptional regulator [Longimicrobiales bacterium]
MKSAPVALPFIRLFGRYLRDQGLPVTQQRERVAEVVFSSSGHLSVEDIEQVLRRRQERIGKATIYRTLDLLVQSKLVAEHDFGEGFKRYEHRLSREPIHEHLICVECGKVIEFRSEEVEAIEARVEVELGFKPARHRLEIYGLCRECGDAGVELEDQGLTCPIETI